MEQEVFKEYAQRWRELVAQVQPPLIEKEIVTMFIDMLPSPSMISSIDFTKKPNQEKKKGEVNAILLESTAFYGQGKGPSPYPTQIFLNKPGPPAVRINPQPPL
ncbi:hypothetical protein CR513_04605, partial [Mucuna pruriens]